MKKRTIDLRGRRKPIIEIASHGRAGPGRNRDYQRILRIVNRVPEVMVKVTGGARTLSGVARSLAYYGRDGQLGMESDTGEHLAGNDFERHIVNDWNLDLESHARQSARAIRSRRQPPRLTYSIVFSMPARTPPKKVLRAVQKFARDEFGFRHRYALALHVDEPHPHVHLVVKAVSEDGTRLYVRKPTLRRWREAFASNLRELGQPANATSRFERGQTGRSKSDGIYRAALRDESTYIRKILDGKGEGLSEPTEWDIRARKEAIGRLESESRSLRSEGHIGLANSLDMYIKEIPRASSERDRALALMRSQRRQSSGHRYAERSR